MFRHVLNNQKLCTVWGTRNDFTKLVACEQNMKEDWNAIRSEDAEKNQDTKQSNEGCRP